jgi:hypothetical protein
MIGKDPNDSEDLLGRAAPGDQAAIAALWERHRAAATDGLPGGSGSGNGGLRMGRGRASIMARAIDSRGRLQPMMRDVDRRTVMITHIVPVEFEVH